MEGGDQSRLYEAGAQVSVWLLRQLCCARASCLGSLLSISIDSGQGASLRIHVCTDEVALQEEGEQSSPQKK